MSQHPLSGARLYSLIGDAMHDLPAAFIDELERVLISSGMPHPDSPTARHLRLVHPAGGGTDAALADQQGPGGPDRDVRELACGRQQALGAILEILHAVHQNQHGGSGEVLLDERLLEGLIVAGRELAKDSAGTPRGNPWAG